MKTDLKIFTLVLVFNFFTIEKISSKKYEPQVPQGQDQSHSHPVHLHLGGFTLSSGSSVLFPGSQPLTQSNQIFTHVDVEQFPPLPDPLQEILTLFGAAQTINSQIDSGSDSE